MLKSIDFDWLIWRKPPKGNPHLPPYSHMVWIVSNMQYLSRFVCLSNQAQGASLNVCLCFVLIVVLIVVLIKNKWNTSRETSCYGCQVIFRSQQRRDIIITLLWLFHMFNDLVFQHGEVRPFHLVHLASQQKQMEGREFVDLHVRVHLEREWVNEGVGWGEIKFTQRVFKQNRIEEIDETLGCTW